MSAINFSNFAIYILQIADGYTFLLLNPTQTILFAKRWWNMDSSRHCFQKAIKNLTCIALLLLLSVSVTCHSNPSGMTAPNCRSVVIRPRHITLILASFYGSILLSASTVNIINKMHSCFLVLDF